jgi:hypothetical protein
MTSGLESGAACLVNRLTVDWKMSDTRNSLLRDNDYTSTEV